MTVPESLHRAIRTHFSPNGVDITRADPSKATVVGTLALYERDRLLETFSRRLVGLCEDPSADRPFLIGVAQFVRNLVRTEPDEQLFTFECTVGGQRWYGWATADCVLWVHQAVNMYAE